MGEADRKPRTRRVEDIQKRLDYIMKEAALLEGAGPRNMGWVEYVRREGQLTRLLPSLIAIGNEALARQREGEQVRCLWAGGDDQVMFSDKDKAGCGNCLSCRLNVFVDEMDTIYGEDVTHGE